MNEGEIDVVGGEIGRVTAFYDSNNHLNIIGGGSLKASAITLVSDSAVTGNSTAQVVLVFQILLSRLQNLSQSINAAAQSGSFNVDFNGVTIAVTLQLMALFHTLQTPQVFLLPLILHPALLDG